MSRRIGNREWGIATRAQANLGLLRGSAGRSIPHSLFPIPGAEGAFT